MEKKIEVVNNNGQLVVSSRQVAETFGKRHDKLLHEIARMYGNYCVGEDTPKMVETPLFYKTTYIHEQNGQTYPMYLMNRDGFSLLAMGFTGSKALEWKLKYIQAFNEMEKTIKEQRDSYMIEDPVERALKWAEEQKEKQKALKALEEAKPKVETYDALVSRESYVGIREMAKLIGYPVNKMGAYLVQIGMIYRDAKDKYKYYPTEKFRANGMVSYKWKNVGWGGRGYMDTVYTLKGVEYVRKSLKAIGYPLAK